MKDEPHSRALRLHRAMNSEGTFFLTKCLIPKRPVLVTLGIADEIVRTLVFSVREKRILLAAFVVMPDHWHALLCILNPMTLSSFMHSTDTWVGNHSAATLGENRTEWQESYRDTEVRSSRQFRYVGHYIEENPVRKGLVGKPDEWKWSSAHPDHAQIITRSWPREFANERS